MTSEKSEQDKDVSQKNSENPVVNTNKVNFWPFLNFALLVVVAAFVYINSNLIDDLSNDRSATDLAIALEKDISSLSGEVSSNNSRVQLIESEISSLSGALEATNASLQSLYSSQNSQEVNFSIAEVEYLVEIANLKLKLESDINIAVVALEEASSRLVSMGDPALFSVRRQLTADINTLKSVPQVDIIGMSLTLSDLVSRLEQLPLTQNSITGEINASIDIDPDLSAWERLLTGVWKEFKSMFIITRTGDGISTSLLPNEKYFLYQNLRLQLESSRLAALKGDKNLLSDSLELAEKWLVDYFETNDAAVVNAIEIIKKLKEIDIDPVIPNVDATLEAIKTFNNNQAVNFSDTDEELP